MTLIHSSISAIVHNNVHKAFYPNLMFLSCGNNLLIVRDPSGVGDWSVCVKTCSFFMMLVCAWASDIYGSLLSIFINVTESLIVLLIIIKIVLYVVIIKIFYFKKD